MMRNMNEGIGRQKHKRTHVHTKATKDRDTADTVIVRLSV